MKYLFWIYVSLFLGFSIDCIGQQSRIDSLNQVIKDHSRWEKDLNKIIDSAYFYRFHRHAIGGGEGSYIGFTLPQNFDSTEFGTYSIYEILPDKLVIQANIPFNKSPLLCIVDSNGNWNNRMNGADYELEKIGALANQYRGKPVLDEGGGGSYVGFKIPASYEWTSFGRYTIKKVQPDEITIQVNCSTERLMRELTFNAEGKKQRTGNYYDPNKLEFRPRGDIKDFIKNAQAIDDDIRVISKQVGDYWMRSKPSVGMRGSFEGYNIPIPLALSKNGAYSIVEVKEDTIYIQAISSIGSGKMYFLIDSNGRSRRLFAEQYHPPVSQLKNNTNVDPLAMYKNADWKLNEVYQQLLAKKKTDKALIKKIINTERLWIKYRDAQLVEKYPKLNTASDKSMFTKPQLIYLTILTENRIKELQEMYDQP
jgi:uncharacterized protein YecT (DUF1311 family)